MVERVKRPSKVVIHSAIECEFCGHLYLEPCDQVRQQTCLNIKLEKKSKREKNHAVP